MVIAIDFDGTCVTNDFPIIGSDIGAVPILRKLIASGHKLILTTVRSDRVSCAEPSDKTIQNVQGTFLTDAVNWFKKHEIPLYGVQKHPTQHEWTTSPKPYAQLYIDDCSLGCPIKEDTSISNLPFVDWEKVEKMLIEQHIINPKL
jgi:hypothetical protein